MTASPCEVFGFVCGKTCLLVIFFSRRDFPRLPIRPSLGDFVGREPNICGIRGETDFGVLFLPRCCIGTVILRF
ncbi:hypothetical protein AR158_c450L [Paramecium bursaria Chlorella virus AR158]|uniref:hypothetical protein n=1 Tax=Paramecium bursaria Chlorella virus AR158 TaxID=380598 RepID=UPI00015AA6E4|nr:hypothetical protein AR158_c450L [Paramecium bursaria Chlorella virus AR158]ABU43995.1 hypothetical protein AR158_c450L [Paramecium bursaria Chlorella virus AR158]